MEISNSKRVFVLCLAGFLSTVMISVSKTWAADTPTEIRFIVSHADCGGTGTFEFFVSEASVGVYPSTQDCYCNSSPLVVTLNDPVTLSLIGPVDCTSISMTLDDPNFGLALGYVRVEIDRTESGTETFCLVDYTTGGTCVDRDLCYGYDFPGASSYSNLVICTYPLGITPADGLSSIGYQGGPFTPAGKDYTLTNLGTNSLDWAAEVNVPWLDVSSGSGTLEPNQNVVVTVSINANANNLAIGSYDTGVNFTNLTSDVSRMRPVTLSVKNQFPDGFGGDATGGAGGPTVTVDNAADLRNYIWAWGNNPLIIQVSGTLNFADVNGINYITITSNKTIKGLDASSTIIGNLSFSYGASNVIIEGLNITNPNGIGGGDGISVQYSTNIFITQCTFYDCADGCLDITNAADYVTVSWCKFYYTSNTGHNFVNLFSASDDATGDRGKLHITFHHNWWSTLCNERMPRGRFGRVHVYNNYYGCPGNSYCIGVGLESQIRVENNYFENVATAWRNPATIPGMIGWNTGNIFVNTAIPVSLPNDYATIFTPPYAYTLDAGENVKNFVMTGAGTHPDGDITPPNPNPMTFATVPYATSDKSITMVATTASDGNGVEYYFICTVGGGHNSGWQNSTTYTDTSLLPIRSYTYTVKARDKSNNQNETAASGPASATTLADSTAPTPNPMTFDIAPYAGSDSVVAMIATTAFDLSGVQYYFTCTEGNGHDSGWQNDTIYIDTGLTENTTYAYTVKARDNSPQHNETAVSSPETVTTLLDTTPPAPDPMTWAIEPNAIDIDSIIMRATTATDISGVEYYFANITDPNHDSGWQDDANYTDTELINNTNYTYSVIARDKSFSQNETAWSSEANATTVRFNCLGQIASDFDKDCKVDFVDYSLMIDYWHRPQPLNNNIAVNGTFDTDIIPGWQMFDLPSAEGTLMVLYDGENGNPVGSVVVGNEPTTIGTSGHYFYQVLSVDTGKQYKLSAEWMGDISSFEAPDPDPCNHGNWADVLVAFETNADANTWTIWTNPNAVMYRKAFGVITQNIDPSGTWPWEPITASQTNGPADGVFTANGDYMVVAFSEGCLPGSGYGYFWVDNLKVEGPECSPRDLDNDCDLDWLDIEQFAMDWLTCDRDPVDECWQ
ncbi:MAG: hypothetical protein WC496_09435 [Phycisphaerae bacterium]|jgi:pectate lyase